MNPPAAERNLRSFGWGDHSNMSSSDSGRKPTVIKPLTVKLSNENLQKLVELKEKLPKPPSNTQQVEVLVRKRKKVG